MINDGDRLTKMRKGYALGFENWKRIDQTCEENKRN
jgi:hypothetical protein